MCHQPLPTDTIRNTKQPTPWRYPGGVRPEFFDRDGPDWDDREEEFFICFFYAAYATHVPGLVSLGDARNPELNGALNPNNAIIQNLAARMLFGATAADVKDALQETAQRVLKAARKTFRKDRGRLENYFVFILCRAIGRWGKRRAADLEKAEFVSLDVESAGLSADVAEETTAADILMAVETGQINQRLLEQLPEPARAKIDMFIRAIDKWVKNPGKRSVGFYDFAAELCFGSAWETMTEQARKAAIVTLRQQMFRLIAQVQETRCRLAAIF